MNPAGHHVGTLSAQRRTATNDTALFPLLLSHYYDNDLPLAANARLLPALPHPEAPPRLGPPWQRGKQLNRLSSWWSSLGVLSRGARVGQGIHESSVSEGALFLFWFSCCVVSQLSVHMKTSHAASKRRDAGGGARKPGLRRLRLRGGKGDVAYMCICVGVCQVGSRECSKMKVRWF